MAAVRAFGLSALPAIVHLGIDGTVVNAVEGWDPPAWRALTVELSRMVGWSRPRLPDPGDPGPFAGAPLPAPRPLRRGVYLRPGGSTRSATRW